MNTPSNMESPPPLLREWSYTGPQYEPPVAPAVVVEEEESPSRPQKSTPPTYPVATFVSNFVRNSIDHIYTGIAETIDESQQEQVTLSVRGEDINTVRRLTFTDEYHPSVRSAPDATFDDEFDEAEFVILDGDLVAIPAPPPNDQELEEIGYQSRRRGRRNFRGLRKWIKKRTTRKQECKDENHERTESPGHASPRRSKRRSRRRSWTGDEPEAAPTVPPMTPITEVHASMSSAVSADFIGNVYEAGVLSAEAYIEPDEKMDTTAPTVQAEKVDVESMLHLAREEADLEQSMDTVIDPSTVKSMLNDLETSCKPQAKGEGCPLSSGSLSDEGGHNDTLKIIMVGDSLEKSTLARALRNIDKKPKPRVGLGVDVHTWTHSGVKFSIWDVQGTSREDGSANAGAHPSTQSLFFSPNSLYLLVWDMAANNIKTRRRTGYTSDNEEDDDDDDDDNEFILEEANRQADAALEADIYEHVLAWVDCIPASNSAILPVVTMPERMDETEVQRRCSILQVMLMNHLRDKEEPKLIFGNESILRVDFSHGVEELQATIVATATDQRERIFDHVGSPVPPETVEVLKIVRRLKRDHKVIHLYHLLAEMSVIASVREINASLHFLASIGELLYFGTDKDDVLSHYIILSRNWLVSALSCILRYDLKRELVETRRFMNMQCAYGGQAFPEIEILKTLLSGAQSSCPILSSTDSSMLWQNMSFMREAADRTSQRCETTNPSTMFEFLECLLVQRGVFLRLNVSHHDDPTPTYFIPSLLAQEASDVWTFKTSESWMTTLCHSWLLREGSPANLMQHVSVSLIQDLYEFSQSVQPSNKRLEHSASLPLARASMNNFLEAHDTVGRIKIHQINFWKSSVLVKIGCLFAEPDSGEVRENCAEIFVSLVNPQSVHCVSSRSVGSGMTRIVICGKGQAGHHGRKLWKSGYGVVLDSIKSSLAHLSNVDRQVVCPECLAHSHPSVACTWAWDDVRTAAQTGNAGVRCMRGHLVDTNLLCGTCKTITQQTHVPIAGPRVSMPVASLLGSVVLVGLWDEESKRIRNVGSGFIVDKKHGLIVTAAHILLSMDEGSTFGEPLCGLKHAKAVIGIIVDNSNTAKFRYFAEIVAHDIANIDACVLRITTRMEHDVEGEGEDCANRSQSSSVDNVEAIEAEKLLQLKMTCRFELEESVRILGFNQGGEGLMVQGKHVNRAVDFAKGYICKNFKAPLDDDSSVSSASTSFCPREEIVVMCPTISGHSGGPCVNEEGSVVGILSRADPVDRQRCYLVPSGELKVLVKVAKEACRLAAAKLCN